MFLWCLVFIHLFVCSIFIFHLPSPLTGETPLLILFPFSLSEYCSFRSVCLSFLASFQENMYKHRRRKLVSSPKEAMCEPMCAQALSRVRLFVTYGLYPTRLLCPWNFPGKNSGAGCLFLLQGIFPTQGSNPYLLHLLHWLVSSLALSHLGSPRPKQ